MIWKTTNYWKKYWKNKKRNIQEERNTWNHPHRFMISALLKSRPWISLIEIGCGACPNLMNVISQRSGIQLGGVDVNEQSIESAKELFNHGLFKVGSADDMMLSDDSTDIILSDGVLMYVGPLAINKYIKEIKRVAREGVLFCELHTENPLVAFANKLIRGYNVRNYKALLKRHGFYDIEVVKVPAEVYSDKAGKKYGYFILATNPKTK